MICVKTFKEKNTSHFNNWDEWIAFSNENYKHAKTKSTINDFVGKCNASDLPSYHPYWSNVVMNNKFEIISKIENDIAIFEKDDTNLKYIYNKTTTIQDLKDRVLKMKKELCQ